MKNLIYMNRMIFQYAKKEAIGYLLVDILICIAASVQLWILQKLVDTFFRTEEIGAAGLMAVGLLGGYFLIMACLNFVKERLKFQLEKKITLNLGTGIVKTLNGLEYQCYEQEQLYNIIEKISDEPYKKFLEGFFCFSGMIGKLSQLLTVFVFIFLISGMGLAVNICLVLAIFYFDYRIIYDGVCLQSDKQYDYKNISLMAHEFGRYRMTTAENIGFGQAEQVDVSKLGLKNVFLGKEDGGEELSGGQWQKIALARCLQKKAQFYILDEPTASMDPVHEREAIKEILGKLQEKTVLLITHRIGFCREMDKILVMKSDHTLAGIGNHEELMTNCSTYQKLYESQAKWY